MSLRDKSGEERKPRQAAEPATMKRRSSGFAETHQFLDHFLNSGLGGGAGGDPNGHRPWRWKLIDRQLFTQGFVDLIAADPIWRVVKELPD